MPTATAAAGERTRRKPFDFDKPRQQLVADSFFRFRADYPASDGVSVYVYRLEPAIDRSRAGIKDNHVDVVADPIDYEYVRNRHGSGKYLLILSDANATRGETERARAYLTINEYDLVPPVIDYKELVEDHPNNRWFVQWARSKGFIKDAPAAADAPAANGLPPAILQQLIDRALTPAAAAPAAAVVPAAAPPSLTELVQVAQLLRGTDSEYAKLLVQVMTTQQQQQPAREPAPRRGLGDLMGEARELLGMLKEMGVTLGGEAAPAQPSWVASLPAILQAVSQGASSLGTLMQQRAAAEALARQSQGRVVEVPAAAAPPVVRDMSPAVPPSPPAAAAPAAPAAVDLNESTTRLLAFADRAVRSFEAGHDGGSFANATLIYEPDGDALLDTCVAFGREVIVSNLSQHPNLAAATPDVLERAAAFVDDLLAFAASSADDDGDAASGGEQ